MKKHKTNKSDKKAAYKVDLKFSILDDHTLFEELHKYLQNFRK